MPPASHTAGPASSAAAISMGIASPGAFDPAAWRAGGYGRKVAPAGPGKGRKVATAGGEGGRAFASPTIPWIVFPNDRLHEVPV